MGIEYKIIDFNTLGGYDDIKIGSWFMKIEDFDEKNKKHRVILTPYSTENRVYMTN